jgi:hypothetical protein
MLIPIAYSYGWLSGIFHLGAIPMASLPSGLKTCGAMEHYG